MFSLRKNSTYILKYFFLLSLFFSVGCQPFVKFNPAPGLPHQKVVLDKDGKPIKNSDGTYKLQPIYETKDYKDKTIEFAEAEAYARMAMTTYKDKIYADAEMQSILSVPLIPMAAAATGLAAYNNNGQAVAALGLAAATGYGMNTFLNLPLRSQVYAIGTKAIGCAITAVRPLDIDGTHLALLLDGDGKKSAGLNGGLTYIDSIIFDIQSKLKGEVNNEVISQATSEIMMAEKTLGIARKTYQAGKNLSEAARQAGGALVDAVDEIGSDVDLAIITTQTKLTALPIIVSSLSDLSRQFTGKPLPTPKPSDEENAENTPKPGTGAIIISEPQGNPPENQQPEKKEKTLGFLREKLTYFLKIVSIEQRKIAAFVEAVKSNRQQKKLEDCGVDSDQFVTDIFLEPSGELILTQGDSGGRIIKGGQKPFMAAIENKAGAKNPTIHHFQTFGRAFSVQTEADTTPGKYNLYITDGKDHHNISQVKVEKKPLPFVSFEKGSSQTKFPTKEINHVVKVVMSPEPEKEFSINWTTTKIAGADGIVYKPVKGEIQFKKGAPVQEIKVAITEDGAKNTNVPSKFFKIELEKGPLFQAGEHSVHIVSVNGIGKDEKKD